MIFEIKILNDFINYTNNLLFYKKIILNSKIFFLETTGFLENCKAVGKGFFEFKVNRIEELQLYCIIDNDSSVVTFSNRIENLKEYRYSASVSSNSATNITNNNKNSNISINNNDSNNNSNNTETENNIINWKTRHLNDLIEYVAEKSEIPKNKLLSILKIRADIEINDLLNAIRYCKNPRSGK